MDRWIYGRTEATFGVVDGDVQVGCSADVCWRWRERLYERLDRDVLENPEGQEEEEAFVLDLLQSTSERWVRDIIKADERAAAELLRYHCQVFQFGSTHLGVTNEASDLDVVLGTVSLRWCSTRHVCVMD